MSLRFASEPLADVRHDAQLLVEHSADQERQLDAFVDATERDVRDATAAVSHATDRVDVTEIRHLLSAQLARTAALDARARAQRAERMLQRAASLTGLSAAIRWIVFSR
jgi:hypothetical protein